MLFKFQISNMNYVRKLLRKDELKKHELKIHSVIDSKVYTNMYNL